jgi:hypothetical protein
MGVPGSRGARYENPIITIFSRTMYEHGPEHRVPWEKRKPKLKPMICWCQQSVAGRGSCRGLGHCHSSVDTTLNRCLQFIWCPIKRTNTYPKDLAYEQNRLKRRLQLAFIFFLDGSQLTAACSNCSFFLLPFSAHHTWDIRLFPRSSWCTYIL